MTTALVPTRAVGGMKTAPLMGWSPDNVGYSALVDRKDKEAILFYRFACLLARYRVEAAKVQSPDSKGP